MDPIGDQAFENNENGFADIVAKLFRQSQNTTENPLKTWQHHKLHKFLLKSLFTETDSFRQKILFIQRNLNMHKHNIKLSICPKENSVFQTTQPRTTLRITSNPCSSKLQIIPLEYSVRRQQESNNRLDQSASNRTLRHTHRKPTPENTETKTQHF